MIVCLHCSYAKGEPQLRYTIEYACVSDRGHVRAINQDNYFCCSTYAPRACERTNGVLSGQAEALEGVLFGVFDGMGGEQAGEDASYLAAVAASEFSADCQQSSLRRFYEEANQRIVAFTVKNDLDVCGSTAAMICFRDKHAFVTNLGDSRVYLVQDQRLVQLSEDQVVPVPGRKKPALVQFLGMTDMLPEPHQAIVPLRDGDCFLICSDGLTDMVADTELPKIIARYSSLREAAQALLEAALAAGGRDNTTIILLRVTAENRKLWDIFPFTLIKRRRN